MALSVTYRSVMMDQGFTEEDYQKAKAYVQHRLVQMKLREEVDTPKTYKDAIWIHFIDQGVKKEQQLRMDELESCNPGYVTLYLTDYYDHFSDGHNQKILCHQVIEAACVLEQSWFFDDHDRQELETLLLLTIHFLERGDKAPLEHALKNHPFNQWSCGRRFLMALGTLVFFAGIAAVAAGFTGAAESYRISSNGFAKVGGVVLSLVSAAGLYKKGWKSEENEFIDSLSKLSKVAPRV